jgi:hypothetical protein
VPDHTLVLPAPRARRPAAWAAPAGAAALALALRAPFFGAPLGIDEGGYAAVARAWSGAGHPFLYGHFWVDRPPLLLLIFRLAVPGGAAGVRVAGASAAVALVGAVFVPAHAVGGRRAAVPAATIAAVLTGSAALEAVYTPGELLAAVPATGSVAALVLAHRRGSARPLVAAGALAVAAVLVKQSALDAAVAGAAFAGAAALRPGRRWWPAAYAAGAALALSALAAYLAASGTAAGALTYALFGFRLDALGAVAGPAPSFAARLAGLGGPLVVSGLVVALPLAVVGIVGLRRDRLLATCLGVWLVAGVAGVLAGGSLWPHYLIQLVPVAALGAGLVLARLPATPRLAVLAAVIGLAAAGAVEDGVEAARHSPQLGPADVGRWVAAHARPGDTQFVLYARANVGWYDRLRTPYPYLWSLMLRVKPDAIPRLRALLASARRPTWVVEWQAPGEWGLDPQHVTADLLARHYRRVATVDGVPVLHRRA